MGKSRTRVVRIKLSKTVMLRESKTQKEELKLSKILAKETWTKFY